MPIKIETNEMQGILVNKSNVFLDGQESATIEVTHIALETGPKDSSIKINLEAVGMILEISVRSRLVADYVN